MFIFRNIDEELTITLDGHEHTTARARLGLYLELEQYKKKLDVVGYLQACGLPTKVSGVEGLRAYIALKKLNRPKVQIPLLLAKIDAKAKEVDWNYEDRWTISYIHIVASAYHWSRADILNLNVDEFYCYVQEILTDIQMDREWIYSLSEIAYPFDSASKTRRFKPLERPSWMMLNLANWSPEKTRMPKGMLPAGLVLGASDLMKH